ncbi:hypothetical protein Pmani_038470 [Petrolisthes manimaculis]|uniref:Uncharacterized protein n=1 Tax=Petrolisthes manimaculis TaxID=1843537 RepID=A0AAE1TKH0_9EUCA|nr:hypothetical protein Pmani_038470 [Petrolisthes manimaculis]
MIGGLERGLLTWDTKMDMGINMVYSDGEMGEGEGVEVVYNLIGGWEQERVLTWDTKMGDDVDWRRELTCGTETEPSSCTTLPGG